VAETPVLGMEMDAEDYRSQIDRAIREMSGETILNGSHAHASIIIERMFAHARECVSILTRQFDPRIYGTSDTIEQARLFLGQPDRRCRIIVEEFDQASFERHPFVVQLLPYLQDGNLQIIRLKDSLAPIINVNYSIMDDAGFRFEEDKKQAVAFAAFGTGTEKFVKNLRKLFDTLWEKGERLNLESMFASAN
jgi:hypothetical protein